jgi:hypothetical protein
MLKVFVAVAATVAVAVTNAAAQASLDDTARFLAGLAPSPRAPLAASVRDTAWRDASKAFNAGWRTLEARELPNVRAWARKYMTARQPVVLYWFSGPDFLYADAIFPNATTYVLSGLEPVGNIPDIMALPAAARPHALRCVHQALAHFLKDGLFPTEDLRAASENCEWGGTLPLLLVLLARTGKEIRDVDFVEIDRDGTVVPGRAAENPGNVDGVKIEFQAQDRSVHALYYFSTDLSDAALSASGFLKFTERLGSGASLLKGASYRLHEDGFATARDFILGRYESIVQDDSGIPLRHFNLSDWWLQPFGNYRTPVTPFASMTRRNCTNFFASAVLSRSISGSATAGARRKPISCSRFASTCRRVRANEGRRIRPGSAGLASRDLLGVACSESTWALTISLGEAAREVTEVAEAARKCNLGDRAMRQSTIQKIMARRVKSPLPNELLDSRSMQSE